MKTLVSALALGATLFLGACNKEEDPQNVSATGPFTTLESVLNLYAAPSQTFTVNADSGGSFQGARGTRFLVPRYAFRQPGAVGDTIHGVVQVTLREFLDRSEMIYSRVVPGNQPSLVSGGAFFFTISYQGKTIEARTTNPITVYLPQRNFLNEGGNLQPYTGSPQPNVISSVVWQPALSPQPVTSADFDTVAFSTDTAGYHMPAFERAFFNPGGNEVTVRFSISGGGLTAGNSFLYVLPKGVRQVIPVGNNKSLQGATFKVQKETSVYLVGISVVNGIFQGNIVEAKLEEGRSYGVNVVDTDPKEFKERILRLL